MTRRASGELALGIVVLFGLAGVWKLQQKIDGEQQAIHLESDDLALRSGNLVKGLSLEYAPLMGAIYWTRTVQYFGAKHQMHDQNLELLWPLLDIATTLDPHLIVAYRFGAIFLGDAPPRGAGQPDFAVRLLERGIQENPEYWRFYQDLGDVYYFDKKDYAKASEAFRKGGSYPDAPIWMKVMAAKIAEEGESLETSYFLWKQVYDTATDPQIKKNAETHLKLVSAQMAMREIDRLAAEYGARTGKHATHLSELVQAGLLKGIPLDPDGYPYVLGEGGKAELGVDSPLMEQQVLQKKLEP
jgi:tetratricopeptide (TPR) repeat protein